MNIFLVWTRLFLKRYCIRIGFWISLVLLPFFCFFLRFAESTGKDEKPVVAVFIDTDDTTDIPITGEEHKSDSEAGLEQQLMSMLINNVETFSFQVYETRKDAEDEVSSGRAECGIIIHGNLAKKVADGKTKGIFEILSSPSSTMINLCIEYVYSQYATLMGSEIVADAIAEELDLKGDDYQKMKTEVENIYREKIKQSSYQMFEYVDVDGKAINESPEEEKRTFPVRGFVSIYLLMMGMFCCTVIKRDTDSGVLNRFRGQGVFFAGWISIMVPLTMSAIFALPGLYITGNFTNLIYEAAVMFCYCAVVAVFCVIWNRIVKSEKLLVGMIPVMILACFLICPVFFDISGTIPLLGKLEKWFLPTWYLRCFS